MLIDDFINTNGVESPHPCFFGGNSRNGGSETYRANASSILHCYGKQVWTFIRVFPSIVRLKFYQILK